MKDEEIDKMADDFVNAQEFTKAYGFARKAECGAFWKYGFLAGLKAGRPQWHDLRKDPTDLPKESCSVFVIYKYESKTYRDNYINDKEHNIIGWESEYKDPYCAPQVIAWCEIPTFDKE